MKEEKTLLLKVLVGSWAHGLADKKSDRDYRGVYILPTSDILSLGYKYKGNHWIEGKEDNTSYELGHFLHLATHSNPTILEIFKAPVIEMNSDGEYLRKCMSWCWDPQHAYDAFLGYAHNQRKKFLDKKDNRQNKFACAYIRTLITLEQLLKTETFSVEVPREHKRMLLRFKKGTYKMGEVVDQAEHWTKLCKENLAHCKHKNNLSSINSILLDLRKKYW